MTDLLVSWLLQHTQVESHHIEAAQQRQVLYGGSLDTSLLEAGVIDEATLLEAMAQAYGIPSASRSDIDAVAEFIPRLFPWVFAETYRLIPIGLENRRLLVLANGPPDAPLLQRVQERLHLDIHPCATLEVRMHYAMHVLYGVGLQPRYRDLLQKLDGKVQAPRQGVVGDAHVLPWGLSAPKNHPASPNAVAFAPKASPLRRLLAAMEQAHDRDGIVDVLFQLAAATFQYTGIFLLQGATLQGWRSIGHKDKHAIVQAKLAIDTPSVFRTVLNTGGHYLGPLASSDIHATFLATIHRSRPRAAFLAPIQVGSKTAAILFADNGQQPIAPARVSALLCASQQAGACFERLIRTRKERQPGPTLASHPKTGSGEPATQPLPDPSLILLDEADFFDLDEDKAASHQAQDIPVLQPPSAQVWQEDPIPAHSSEDADEDEDEDEDEIELAWDSVAMLDEREVFAQDDSIEATTQAFIVAEEEAHHTENLRQAAEQPSDQTHTHAHTDTEAEANTEAEASTEEIGDQPQESHVASEETSSDQTQDEEQIHVAFAQLDDEPEASLDDWEDVLVETSGLGPSPDSSSSSSSDSSTDPEDSNNSNHSDDASSLDTAARSAQPLPSSSEQDGLHTPSQSNAGAEGKTESSQAAPVQVPSTDVSTQAAEQPNEAITWLDVVAEARRAQIWQPVPAQAPMVEVAGESFSQTDLLLDGLAAQSFEQRKDAAEGLLALYATDPSILDAVAQNFPGQLDQDPLAASAGGVRIAFADLSGVTLFLSRLGAAAWPKIAPHIESSCPKARYAAVAYLAAIHTPKGCAALGDRLCDKEAPVRELATTALRRYAQEEAYGQILESLREQLAVDVLQTRLQATQILGQLRDPRAVPSLIPHLVGSDESMIRAVVSALALTCAQSFGQDITAWQNWWQGHYNQPRVEWLVEGLQHSHRVIRHIAHSELERVTGHSMPFDPDADLVAQEQCAQAWRAWLAQTRKAAS